MPHDPGPQATPRRGRRRGPYDPLLERGDDAGAPGTRPRDPPHTKCGPWLSGFTSNAADAGLFTTVDEAAWGTLRADVARAFAELRAALAGDPDLSDPIMLRGVLALASHAAYHLGAIRVLVKQFAA